MLESIWEQPGIEIQGSLVSVFSDLRPITLRKRRQLQFLTTVLRKKGLRYSWDFSFRLFFEFSGECVSIRSVQEAENCLEEIGGT